MICLLGDIRIAWGVADCSCCKKKDKGGRGLLRIPLGATVLVLLMLQIYRYRPSVRRILPQRSDMILLAEKKVYHVLEGCQGGRGREKKEIELRIHMTVFSYLQSAKTSITVCVQLDDLVQQIPRPCSDPWSTSWDL